MKERHTRVAPISVVIPAYNAESTLRDTLESVRSQTLAPAEVVVIDDGSADATARIARGFGAIVISQENRGLPAARNAGIMKASQPWIALLDADDLWHPDKIARQWEALQSCGQIGMVTCDTLQFQSDTGEVTVPSLLALPEMRYGAVAKTRVSASVACFPEIIESFHQVGMFMQPSSVIVRRDLLVQVGMFDEALKSSEDVECFLRVLKLTGLVVVEAPLLHYRLHANNMSKNEVRMLQSYIEVAERVLANPDSYAVGTAAAVSKALPHRMLLLSRLLLREGRTREARQHLLRSLHLRKSATAISLLGVSLLPRIAIVAAIHVRRALTTARPAHQKH
jgi:glycosyltransferase involved in cell wall biosynthesis